MSKYICDPEKTFELDPYLRDVQGQIWDRAEGYKRWMTKFESEGGLRKFAEGYNIFGFQPTKTGLKFTEWLPGAKSVFLTGEYIFPFQFLATKKYFFEMFFSYYLKFCVEV